MGIDASRLAVLEDEQRAFRDWAWGIEASLPDTRISSLWRAPRFTGDDSQHLLGLAVDFTNVAGDATSGDVPAITGQASGKGYVVVPESDHLHVQRFEAGFLRRCGLVP